MNRRKFLRVSLLSLAGLLLPVRVQALAPAALPASATAGHGLDMGLEQIRAKVSASLGPQFTVLKVFHFQNLLYARVSFQANTFYLKSMDGSTWYTAEWSAPRSRHYGLSELSHG